MLAFEFDTHDKLALWAKNRANKAKLENASTDGKNLEKISELQIGLRPNITIRPSTGKVLWPSTRRANLRVSTKGEGYLNLKIGGKCSSPVVKGKRCGRKIEVEGHAEDTCLHPRAK